MTTSLKRIVATLIAALGFVGLTAAGPSPEPRPDTVAALEGVELSGTGLSTRDAALLLEWAGDDGSVDLGSKPMTATCLAALTGHGADVAHECGYGGLPNVLRQAAAAQLVALHAEGAFDAFEAPTQKAPEPEEIASDEAGNCFGWADIDVTTRRVVFWDVDFLATLVYFACDQQGREPATTLCSNTTIAGGSASLPHPTVAIGEAQCTARWPGALEAPYRAGSTLVVTQGMLAGNSGSRVYHHLVAVIWIA